MKQKPLRICEKRVNKGYKLSVNYINWRPAFDVTTLLVPVSQKHVGGTKRSNFNVVLKIQYSTKSKNLNGKLLKNSKDCFKKIKKLGVRGTLSPLFIQPKLRQTNRNWLSTKDFYWPFSIQSIKKWITDSFAERTTNTMRWILSSSSFIIWNTTFE